jgi:hypothetical protein
MQPQRGEGRISKTIAYSSLNWKLLNPIYDPITQSYSQSVKEIPETTMDLLYPLLLAITRRYGSIRSGTELQRILLIHPILVYVLDLKILLRFLSKKL